VPRVSVPTRPLAMEEHLDVSGISILILTLNEEINLPGCLRNVRWSDDVVVLDSLSKDASISIAREAGARVFERKFDNWSAHCNWALDTIEFRNEWVLMLDADERVTPALLREMRRVVARAGPNVGAFAMRRRNMLMGKWIRHASLYDTWLPRLMRRGRVRYEDRLVHPLTLVDGETGRLREAYIHHSFNKGFADWFEKHNRYSDFEAVETIRHLREGRVELGGLFGRDPILRRRALKTLSFRMPMRPFAKFVYYYFVKGGFLDGGPGLTYAVLQSIYEYMICLKVKEIRQRERGLPV
jgi:glycosyltransferase involved in cell wall biosynthesis